MLIPVEPVSFAVNSQYNAPMVILRECAGGRTCSVTIGPLEASAIAVNTLNVVSEKPNTSHLLRTVIRELGATIEKAVICGSSQDLCGRLYLVRDGGVKIIDCRPGDAISLAIQCKSGLFVHENLFESAPGQGADAQRDALRAAISNMDTLEFGRYYLE